MTGGNIIITANMYNDEKGYIKYEEDSGSLNGLLFN